jgi:dipeptidyl aminopeptidase/acylaminoacyl peptidase
VTRLPQYWAVGVDFVGPSNLVTFAKAVPPTWKRMMKEWVGDPEEDADMLMARSPITYVDNIRAPLLVVQGAKDPRVVKAESDQMVERIRANGGDVTYHVDEHEGHGATRRENRLKWWRWMADFLEERLLD